jgi:hypothetical protein
MAKPKNSIEEYDVEITQNAEDDLNEIVIFIA